MKKLLYITLATLLLAACAKKNEVSREKRQSYHAALEDSIKNVSAEIDSCNDVAKTLSDKVANLIPEFRVVEKSREVEGYMIFQGWQNRYPLQETGLVARLSASRQIELVAVLRGGAFDQIRVNGPSVTAISEVVPNDQALNYRRDGLTTVLFTGVKADSIASLIADNELNPVTVTFLNGGRSAGSWKLPNANSKMITMSWILYSSNKEQKALEQKSMMLGEKLKILRKHYEEEKDRFEQDKQIERK